MKITLLANRDLPACLALNYLWPVLAEHDVTLFLSSRVGKAGGRPPELERLAFFEQSLCNDVLFPALDQGQVAGKAELQTFQGLARRSGRPLRQLTGINDGEGLELLQASAPELIISIRFGLILRAPVLQVPAHGVLNLHSGLLPDYKGVMATFRALANGDAEIGTTLHYIDDASIDTGRVIGTTRLPVVPGKSYFWHVLALYEQGCALMADSVTRIAAGETLPARAQAAGGDYYTFPTPAELTAFAAQGLQLINHDDVLEVTRRFLPSFP